MKKLLLFAFLISLAFVSNAQYLRIAEQGKVWYSGGAMGSSYFTEVFAVEGDTLIGAEVYPLLVQKDSALVTTDTVAYLDEDTLAGTLGVYFFGGFGADQFYDFSLGKGDTVDYHMRYSDREASVRVDSVYHITDFRGVSRKVLTFEDYDGTSCGLLYSYAWIEGLGSANLLATPLPECGLSHVPGYELRCAFMGSLKIYGDTVQECYEEKISLKEEALATAEIFPNPVQGNFIEVSSELPLERVEILDYNGKTLIEVLEPSGKIDVGSLMAGMYVIRTRDVEGNRRVGKLVVE